MKTNGERGEHYYTLVAQKNIEGVAQCLHKDVEFIGPLAVLKGKDAAMGAISNFVKAFRSLKIRAKFGSEDQAMIVYDVDLPGVGKNFPGASLLTFRDGLIVKIELFYDGGKAVEKKEEIFSKEA